MYDMSLSPLSPFFDCVCLQEMGVIGPNNQLPRRRAGRGRGGLHTPLHDNEDNSWTGDIYRGRANDRAPAKEDDSNVSEALSLFPQPKSLLNRVIQVATSSNNIWVCSSLCFGR